jgi:voltage-gated potassium channel
MERFSSRTKIFIGLGMIIGIIVIGVTGYMIIEDDNFIDAMYMTVITISTVGFGEIHKLSQGGKIFTMFLIISSFTTYAYALTTISTHFFEGQLSFILRGYGSKTLRKMQNHIVICGYGRNGQQVAKELKVYMNKYVIIDQKKEEVESVLTSEDNFIEGDATLDEILIRANIKTAKGLITTLPIDADNLYVVLTARALNPDLEIISRASNESSETKLRMAGVDSVVMPERVGGAHMANLITRPDIIEFLDHVSLHGQDPTTLEEIICSDMSENLKLKSIFEIGIRKVTGANIIGYKTPDGRYVLNPTPDTRVIPGTKLFVLGTPEQINKMREILKSPQ